MNYVARNAGTSPIPTTGSGSGETDIRRAARTSAEDPEASPSNWLLGGNDLQQAVYLVLVLLSGAATAVLLTVLCLQRAFFRRRLRAALVAHADLLLRLTLLLTGLLLTGAVGLIIDITLGRTAATLTAAFLALIVLLSWAVIPLYLRTRHTRQP